MEQTKGQNSHQSQKMMIAIYKATLCNQPKWLSTNEKVTIMCHINNVEY